MSSETYIVTLDKESGQTVWHKKIKRKKATIWEVLLVIIKVIILVMFIVGSAY